MRVKIVKDGKERYGRVVEAYAGASYASALQPDSQPEPVAIRVWLDGEAQPEHDMRKPSEVTPV